jgi:hypothetical protein
VLSSIFRQVKEEKSLYKSNVFGILESTKEISMESREVEQRCTSRRLELVFHVSGQ